MYEKYREKPVGLVFPDDDGVRHGQQTHHGGAVQEVDHLLLIHSVGAAAGEVFHLHAAKTIAIEAQLMMRRRRNMVVTIHYQSIWEEWC